MAACDPVADEADSGSPQAVDAGRADAGAVDAGVPDAGLPDAAVDAGPVDAGFDGGFDGGFDAGLDAGADAGLDAGPADAGYDAGTVRFIAVGDTGHANRSQYAVGAAMGRVCASLGCDFVVLLGDNFYESGVSSTTDPLWQTAFVLPYASVNAPFYAVLGNHDYGGGGAGTEEARALNQLAYSQVNPKWRMPGLHYRWSQGPVDFFAADTNRSFNPLGTYSQAQLQRDFGTWLPASTAPWKIVFGHHPYLSNGEHGNAGSYDPLCVGGFCRPTFAPINGIHVKEFMDSYVCGKADFYICGHDHSMQWPQGTCGGKTQFIVSGSGSSPTSLPGVNATNYQSNELGFTYIVMTEHTFTASFYLTDGGVDYTRTVVK